MLLKKHKIVDGVWFEKCCFPVITASEEKTICSQCKFYGSGGGKICTLATTEDETKMFDEVCLRSTRYDNRMRGYYNISPTDKLTYYIPNQNLYYYSQPSNKIIKKIEKT